MEENNLNNLQGDTVSLGSLLGQQNLTQPSQVTSFVNNVNTNIEKDIDNTNETITSGYSQIIDPNNTENKVNVVTETIPESQYTATIQSDSNLQVSKNDSIVYDSNIAATGTSQVYAPIQETSSVQETTQVQSQETEIKEAVEEIKEEPQVSDKIILKTSVLQEMVNRARLIANPSSPSAESTLCKIIQMTFSEEGFITTATDGRNYIREVNSSTKFTQDLCVGVSSEIFPELVGKLTCDEVELSYDTEKRNIILHCADGSYTFQEQYDIATGEAINIEIPDIYSNISYETLDLADFCSRVGRSVALVADSESNQQIAGTYCSGEDIYQTDGDAISITANVPAFASRVFYLTNTNAKILAKLNLQGQCQVGYVYDENNMISNIVFKQNQISLYLMMKDYEDFREFPAEAIKVWKETPLNNSATIKRLRLANMVDKAIIFADMSALPDQAEFTGINNILRIYIDAGMMEENIVCPDILDKFTPYNISLKLLKRSLNALPDEDIAIAIGNSADRVVQLKGKDQKVVIIKTSN